MSDKPEQTEPPGEALLGMLNDIRTELSHPNVAKLWKLFQQRIADAGDLTFPEFMMVVASLLGERLRDQSEGERQIMVTMVIMLAMECADRIDEIEGEPGHA